MNKSDKLSHRIESWASSRSSNVSIETYRRELSEWRDVSDGFHAETTLEIGAGMGFFSAVLVDENITNNAIAIDPIVEKDGTSRNMYYKNKNFINSMYGDKIRFENKYFPEEVNNYNVDMIVFRKVLHHIYEDGSSSDKDVIKGFEVAKSCLSKGGWIYILESDVPILWVRLMYDFKRYINNVGPMDWSEKRSYDKWANLLSSSGFSDIKVKRLPYNIAIGYPVAEYMTSKISNRYLIVGRC